MTDDTTTATRAALSRIATNVAIVATVADGAPHGVTANVWAEGAEPPVVLVTLRNEGATLDRVMGSRHFAASVLGSSQADVALRFARQERHPGARFDDVGHRLVRGSPVLTDCHAWFSCATDRTAPFGSYTIVVGRVLDAGAGALSDPLVFHAGGFHMLHGAQETDR